MTKLIDLLTEGHELYFPPLLDAMEANSLFAAAIAQAIHAERVMPVLLSALEDSYGPLIVWAATYSVDGQTHPVHAQMIENAKAAIALAKDNAR